MEPDRDVGNATWVSRIAAGVTIGILVAALCLFVVGRIYLDAKLEEARRTGKGVFQP